MATDNTDAPKPKRKRRPIEPVQKYPLSQRDIDRQPKPLDPNKPLYGSGGQLATPTVHPVKYELSQRDSELRELTKSFFQDGRRVWRMPKVMDDDDLVKRIDQYIDWRSEIGGIVTFEEICSYCGYTSTHFLQIENGIQSGFSQETKHIIGMAKEFIKDFDTRLVASGKGNVANYIFRAKNYYGMKDESQITVTPGNGLGDTQSADQIRAKLAGSDPEVDPSE